MDALGDCVRVEGLGMVTAEEGQEQKLYWPETVLPHCVWYGEAVASGVAAWMDCEYGVWFHESSPPFLISVL